MRFPTLVHSLSNIRHLAPDSVEVVVDIGAQRKTDFLMKVFPDKLHLLFEPVEVYHLELEDNYRNAGIKYELLKIALTDHNRDLYLHNLSMDNSGRITHSQLLESPNNDMPFLVEIKGIQGRTLDGLDLARRLPRLSFIVKMDVDGVEEKIISGGRGVLEHASFIIIEASLGRQDLFSRAAMLETLGFRLFDICDHAYYYDQLALVDLVFINQRVRAKNIKFRPWEYTEGRVIWSKWQHGFKDLEADQLDDAFAS